VIVLLLLLLDY